MEELQRSHGPEEYGAMMGAVLVEDEPVIIHCYTTDLHLIR